MRLNKLVISLYIGPLASIAISAPTNTIEVYQGPGANTYKSRLYSVDVLDRTGWLPSYVYGYSRVSKTPWHFNSAPTVNFTTFGTISEARIRIAKLGGFINSAEVSPQSKNIPLQISSGQVEMVLKQGDKAWITLNGDDANPLFVFADGLKPIVPRNATYFGPGVSDIAPANNNHYIVMNDEVIYLDAGAWVRGNFDLRGKRNVKIMGPGILSGDLWQSETVQASPTFKQMVDYAMVRGDFGGVNGIVEGITIVASPTYNFFGGTKQATNVKLLSPWYWSTDGFQAVNTVVKSFAFIGDNVFFPIWAGAAASNITVRDSFVGTTTNAVFCGGYWGNESNERYTSFVDNVDIKTYNSAEWVQYGAPLTPSVFQVWVDNEDSSKGYRNQTYQNIRVEGDLKAPLLMLKNMAYPWGGAQSFVPALGNSHNLVFRNVKLTGTQPYLSEIKGLDANNGFRDVSFENLEMNGAEVTQANWHNFFAVNQYVWNLSFVVRPSSIAWTVPTDANACKNGGWQNLRRADGSSFKNQGDCIQYVNTGK